jgi:hypothetical protein
MTFVKSQKDCLDIFVRVQPRASMNKIVGVIDNRLKIKLKAPPVDGAANKMCIQFIAKLLHAPKSHIEIISGKNSRQKTIRVMCEPMTIMQHIKKINSCV